MSISNKSAVTQNKKKVKKIKGFCFLNKEFCDFAILRVIFHKFKFSLKDFVLLSFMYSMYVTAHMTQPWL